jgi:hypothetical protein
MGAVTALLTLSLLAACAIEPGGVEVNGRPVNVIAGNPATKPDLSRHDRIDDAVVLVRRFLEASADDPATRLETLRSYLLKGETWSAGSVLNLVHDIQFLDPIQQADGYKVQVRVHHVGVFNEARGTIEQPSSIEETIEFIAVKVPGEGYQLRAPRAELLLSDTGFLTYFEARPVYFWDTSASVLVPDLRYLPKYLPEAAKANRLVEWLYQQQGGSPPWLDATLHKIPLATKPADRVTVTDDRSVVVNLNTQPSADELLLIQKQMLKTLVLGPVTRLQLKVQNRVVANLQPESDVRPPPNRYASVKGVVYRLRAPSGGENHSPVMLPEAANKNVAEIAFARGEGAAMVVHDTPGGPRLSVVLNGTLVIPVALPDLPAPRRIAQPVWLGDSATTALVLADETLYQVTADGKAAKVAQVDGLTAMSVSPDARRIALVVNGQLFMAALLQTDRGLALGQNQANVPTLLSVVHSVAFGSPLELFVAGRDETSEGILTMNLDGAWQSVGKTPLAGNVFHLVADGVSSNAMYEATSLGSWVYQFRGPDPLDNKVIFPGVAPSPSTVPNTDVHAPSFEG